jgi:hypothetical protein
LNLLADALDQAGLPGGVLGIGNQERLHGLRQLW